MFCPRRNLLNFQIFTTIGKPGFQFFFEKTKILAIEANIFLSPATANIIAFKILSGVNSFVIVDC